MVRALVVVVALAWCTACPSSGSDRTTQQLAELQKKKEAEAKAKKEKEDALEKLPTQTELLTLDAPYDDRQSAKINAEGPCPEGIWALFPGDPPGDTPELKKANGAKRKELADALKDKQFLVKLRAGAGVTLKPYDAAAGTFSVEVGGTIDCTDPGGRVALAWGDPKVLDPSAGKPGELAQNVWTAAPVLFSLPMKSQVEAKEFEQKNKIGISARVVFKLGKVEVDKKLKKVGKVVDKNGPEEVGYGGGTEDWGAGRLVHVELLGIRVANEREKHQLFDLRGTQ